MAVSYEWIWGPMDVQNVGDLQDVVTGIHWVCFARDSDHTDAQGKDSGLMPTPAPDENSFVTIDQITFQMVQDWIAANMDKPAVEAAVLALLNQTLTPSVKQMKVPTDAEIQAE